MGITHGVLNVFRFICRSFRSNSNLEVWTSVIHLSPVGAGDATMATEEGHQTSKLPKAGFLALSTHGLRIARGGNTEIPECPSKRRAVSSKRRASSKQQTTTSSELTALCPKPQY
mmetsp:Transcript_6159/g.8678  ORF Transcript_6159/g.8678 Transcript_6159/m.8678 type:complete len:115 (+) Transcript_6159:1165-1509(+)